MMHMGARFYLPTLGPLLTQEPVGHEGGLNLYAYCDNGPLTRVDPDGKDWDWGQYWSDVKSFWGGEMDNLNLWSAAWGLGTVSGYLEANSYSSSAWQTVGMGVLDGFNPFNKEDMWSAGKAFGGDLLLFTPAIGKIPAGRAGSISDKALKAGTTKGYYNLGVATADQTYAAGRRFLGPGYKRSRSGEAWISADGKRQFRGPTYKPRQGKTQANFESRVGTKGKFTSNGHVDVKG